MPASWFRRWVIALGPLIVIGTFLLAKLVCFSIRVNLGTAWFHGAFVDSGAGLLAASSMAILLLLFAPLLCLGSTYRLVGALLLNLGVTTILLADLLYFRFFDDVLSLADLPKATLIPYILPSISHILRRSDTLYYLDILAAAIALPFYVRAYRSLPDLPPPARARIAVAVLAAAVISAVPALRLIWTSRHDLTVYATVRRDIGTGIGVLPYHFYEAVTSVVAPLPGTWGVDESERQHVSEHVALLRRQRTERSSQFGAAIGRNLILISAESLQAFPLELEIAGQPIMPNLQAFARESLNFVRFYDQTNLGTTADAEFMALQSLYPLSSGCVWYSYSGNAYRAVPTILTEHGYATVSACGTDPEFMSLEFMHNRYGVQLSYFNRSFTGGTQINGWLSDWDFFRQLAPLLQGTDSPFMAFFLSSSGHDPFDIPDSAKSMMLDRLDGTRLGNYLHAMHYFDQAFGEFVRDLRETGLLDDSVVAVYGDHQGFLGNPPELATLLGFDPGNTYDAWFATKRVPFLIRLPGGAGAGPREALGGHLDMAPTLLSLLGIVTDDEMFMGRDLTASAPPLVVFRDGSFINETHLFLNRRGARPALCFDTSTRQSVDCAGLEPLRRTALDRLAVSDLILAGDLIPTLAPATTVRALSLEELPPPLAYSADLGLEHVTVSYGNLDAHPPSGATFSVETNGQQGYLIFTPSFHSTVPTGKTDGVTFEIWQGKTKLYGQHLTPGEAVRPVRLRLPHDAVDAESVSFITRPGPANNSEYDWALWRQVRIVLAPR